MTSLVPLQKQDHPSHACQVSVVCSGMWKNGGSLRDIAGAFARDHPSHKQVRWWWFCSGKRKNGGSLGGIAGTLLTKENELSEHAWWL